MSLQEPAQSYVPGNVPVIPESAPFNPDQRAWLNGFFAGLLSLEAAGAAAIQSGGGLPGMLGAPAGSDGDDGTDPWHDAAMPIDERMALAEGRPLRRKLYASMAQQDCGQCGYLCESYAEKIAAGEESRLNLCVPGGKETSRMLKRLMEEAPASAVEPPPDAAAPSVTEAGASNKSLPGYSREAPVTAIFREARRITGDGSAKDTRHVVFDLTSAGIEYQPGDSFGVYAHNDPALVDAVLQAMNAPADFPIGEKTLRQALIEDYDLGTAPDMLFELTSYVVGGDRRRKAKALAKGNDPDGDAATFDVLKVIEALGPMHPDPEAFVECLEPLQPRLYSISSSPLASPGELHLTVDTVRYEIDGRKRHGVASTFLADRTAAGTQLKVYVQRAHGFGLPADPSAPIIMVGPGTGIAPFRSFLWHRHETQASGRAWLFFGHQRESTDFFYREELEKFLAEGTLSKLSTAWSRDGDAKVYVQDRMRENAADLWAWLQDGAHFYVCGDAKRMARDVETALVEIARSHGGKSPEQASDYVRQLKASGRYQADVY